MDKAWKMVKSHGSFSGGLAAPNGGGGSTMLRRGVFGLIAAVALLAVAAVAMYLPSPQGAEEASTPCRLPTPQKAFEHPAPL
jgi:predicted MFS family arabinose efflux permease